MTYLSDIFTGDEFHAHFFGALGQLPQRPFVKLKEPGSGQARLN
jgi:hypothetical protein